MDQNTLLTIFVGLAALAMLFQAGMLFGTYRATKAMQEKIAPLIPKVEALVESSRAVIDDNRVKVAEITVKANDILDSARVQIHSLEELVKDASTRSKRQLDHAEVLVDDALDRAEHTVRMVHQGIIKPLRNINGVAAGVAAALQFLMKGGRPNPDRVTVDEEMFI